MPILKTLTRGRRWRVTVPLTLLLGFLAWQGLCYWWYRGYSRGTRTGIVRKVSLKGPPYCKFTSVEMVLSGLLPGAAPEVWNFSLDDDKSPLLEKLRTVERSGARITVEYRQDLHKWWACADTEYFAVGVE